MQEHDVEQKCFRITLKHAFLGMCFFQNHSFVVSIISKEDLLVLSFIKKIKHYYNAAIKGNSTLFKARIEVDFRWVGPGKS